MNMLRILIALAAGSVFGLGLTISGMIDPARVRNFLDVAGGHWDPSLMFVLGGAFAVALAGVAIMRRLAHPLLAEHFHLPAKKRIDTPLLLGSALFGAGWGMAGFCPGPAVASLSLGIPSTLIFVAAMVAGMQVHDRLFDRSGA
jgi:uncharacterized membrane protein YedE/YeeE